MDIIKNFEILKNELNESFNEVVVLTSQLISINRSQISFITELNSKIDNILNNFVISLLNEVEKIYISLTKKMKEIDIIHLKNEIEEATSSFLDITVDLELLSYNTICKTLNLEKKGASIAYISHEIKKHSDRAKILMKGLIDDFNKIYKNYGDTIKNLELLKQDINLGDRIELENISKNLVLKSDISTLIEYLQFQDIYNQQIEKFVEPIIEIQTLEDSPKNLGKKLKIYEETIKILIEMQKDINDALTRASKIIKDYVYNLNTDFQNSISKTEIIRITLKDIFKKGEILLASINSLTKFLKKIFISIDICCRYIKQLEKFSKSFYVLIVLTSIEISRIGEKSMYGLTDFMNKTHKQLINLVDKLTKTIKIWENLAKELEQILNTSKKNYEKFEKIDIEKELENVTRHSELIEKKLDDLREELSKKNYVELIEEYRKIIISTIKSMQNIFEQKLKETKSHIDDSIKNLAEFQNSYENTTLIKVKSKENDSNIELF